MLVKDIIGAIEVVAPVIYQEDYDNCGLQVGEATDGVTGVLLTLDVTEDVLEEAIARNCNMIVAHHPLIFSGLKRISGRNYVERIVRKAIKNDICIYAAHTNLDNMYEGVNAKIAEKLGLVNTRILSAKTNTLSKLYTYAPLDIADKVRDALFAAGAGHIKQYRECSFNTTGTGTFRAAEGANPAIGEAGGAREQVDEVKIEVIVEKHNESRVLKTLFENHIYEEVAYELVPLPNPNQHIGAGMLGELPSPMAEVDFLACLNKQMKTDCIRHTALGGNPIKNVAICGGSGSFLLKDAISAGADVFITGDFKYHQFFDAEGKIIIADIGHYESEQFTPEIFETILRKKFPTFAILLSNINTNPVKYYY
jgi:dinuclear metal center YbgI/SA1388 family protein